MLYSSFTIRELQKKFGLFIHEVANFFEPIPEVELLALAIRFRFSFAPRSVSY
jgi:hypothetical protein